MKIFEIIKYPLILLIFGLCIGCGNVKQIPVQTVEKVVVKDSTIYINDTVTIEVPKEVVKEVVPQDTVSILSTKLATSEAKIYNGSLYHKLTQKGTLKAQIDTVVTVQYVDRYINKEIPIEVVVEKKVVPTWSWISLIINIVILLIIAFRIYLKFKVVI